MVCELCGVMNEFSMCEDCVSRLESKQHAVICIRCRKTIGPKQSVVWLNRNELEPASQEALQSMQDTINGSCMFVRETCDTCETVKNGIQNISSGPVLDPLLRLAFRMRNSIPNSVS